MTTISKRCLVCRTKFEPKRSDAVYCSAKCKSKAFYDRDKSKITAIEETKEVFFIDEYEEILEMLGVHSEDFPFILYCFYRRNLKAEKGIKDVHKYINAIWEPRRDIQKKESYSDFENLFLSGKYEINPSKTDQSL